MFSLGGGGECVAYHLHMVPDLFFCWLANLKKKCLFKEKKKKTFTEV